MCPKCGKQNFFNSTTGRKCSFCGYEMIVPPHGGIGGKGQKCSNCGKFTVFDDKCRNCGATYR